MGLFETLVLNHKKAEFIRFLTVEGCRNRDSENQLAAKALISVLPTLTSLTDLRVMFFKKGEASFINEFNAILTSCHFHLHTLFCDEWLDHAEIVKNQPDLQFLGIYGWGAVPIQFLKQLCAELVPIPMTFCLGREGGYPVYDSIGLFPSFLHPETARGLCRALQPIFECNRGSQMDLASDRVTQVSLFFETVGDTDFVAAIILEMAKYFPNVYWLILLAQRLSRLEMVDIKKVISPVRELYELCFSQWYEPDYKQVARSEDVIFTIHIDNDKKLRFAQEWEGICPDLEDISFFDGVVVKKREGRWEVMTY
ncbi:hypothetical protein DXG01_005756 [Tephrocybe rancida]|nr:hypothetical protein DXG01_005756 [Tephrocybe rancida]